MGIQCAPLRSARNLRSDAAPPPPPPPPSFPSLPPTTRARSFLLSRDDYAFFGHGWEGCSLNYEFPAALSADYGVPVDELCRETAPNSQIFVREWTKSTIQMDCTSWTPTITMKEG